jgi:transcription initiation factor TFIID/TFIIF subunit
MREWSLKVFLLDEDGNERPADVFTKVVYNLHPTFENPVQSMFQISPSNRDHRDADQLCAT